MNWTQITADDVDPLIFLSDFPAQIRGLISLGPLSNNAGLSGHGHDGPRRGPDKPVHIFCRYVSFFRDSRT
jgi:hypothetical protein